MPVRWITLASGSAGNASFLEVHGRGLLVDIGLTPRRLAARLDAAGSGWPDVSAVVLTHTHGDHWNAQALERLLELQIPLYCHVAHCRALQVQATELMQELQFAQLVRPYDSGTAFSPIDGLQFKPLRLSHDGGPTFGFRIEETTFEQHPAWAIGYASDLGTWDRALVEALVDVDLLALEFNHDVTLQRNSRRPGWLKARILGDFGHLSNVQAAHLLGACLRKSNPGRLQHVVQLHLSRECNRPELAAEAAHEVLAQCARPPSVQAAGQDAASAAILVSA